MADVRFDLSVVVVAWNVAPFIEEAVRSCLAQTHASVEIVVVENNSDDDTLAIIERLTADQPHVRIVRNASNVGLGSARNQGVETARGEYVAFLDGDDWLAPEAAARAIAAARQYDADVVVFDHSRHHASGRVQAGHNRRFLAAGLCETQEDRFRVVRSFTAAWNKIYRREFLIAEGFRFSNTFYEDLDWSLPILMVAPRVAAIPDSLLNYRLRRGSILRSRGPQHLDVYQRWRSVMEFMRQNQNRIDPAWRMMIASLLFRQQEAMLRSGLRGSIRRRAQFAREAQALYREFDPDCALQLPAVRRMRYVLAHRGHSWLALALTLVTTLPKR